jgi:hypothetical protein
VVRVVAAADANALELRTRGGFGGCVVAPFERDAVVAPGFFAICAARAADG